MNAKQQQPEPAYIDSDGKLRDDGLHDEMLDNPKANAAFQQLAFDAAIKRGMSRTAAEKCYGKGSTRQVEESPGASMASVAEVRNAD